VCFADEGEGEEGIVSESDNEDEKSDVSAEDQKSFSSEDGDVSNEEEDIPDKHDTNQTSSEPVTNDAETNTTSTLS
jgi:hypothetical protein